MLAQAPFRIAVLVEMSSAHGRGIIRGIAEYARQNRNFSLTVEESGPLSSVPVWFHSWNGQGVIARIETQKMGAELLSRKIPVVNVSGRASPENIPHVDTDNDGIASLAVEYFKVRGFPRFAYLGNPTLDWSHWRQAAFEKQLGHYRLKPEVFQYTHSEATGARLLDWLHCLPKPVAILACNDQHGRFVLDACSAGGIQVPAEASVLGVDDDDILCTLGRPQLSSITPNAEGIGFKSLETLHHLLLQKGFKTPAQQWIPPISIHPRESTDATSTEDWHLRQALRFIQGKAVGDIRVEDVAGHVGVSRRYLEYRFQNALGRSIHDEILRLRLESAQRLLCTTALSVKDIAIRAGFKRADYLSTVFRKILGTTPSAYREEKRPSHHDKGGSREKR